MHAALSVVFGRVFVLLSSGMPLNVFLNQRKKEIGIYTFMGLDNVRIGKMYALGGLVYQAMFSLLAGLLAGDCIFKIISDAVDEAVGDQRGCPFFIHYKTGSYHFSRILYHI